MRGRKNPTSFKMKLELEIPMIRLADLLCEGFEGGIGYWARIVDYDEPKELKYTLDKLSAEENPGSWEGREQKVHKYIDYPLNEGGAVYLMDVEMDPDDQPEIYKLDHEALMRGLKLMNEKAPRHFANWISENDDAETGDVFIQYCVLGDIVYG